MRTYPLISVITVVFNDVDHIEHTILSVLNQTYPNIEYIVIDGGSEDGTVDIIKKYADRLAYWVSEPDKGIYDAMNKGIDKCTGEWVNFMNCGDSFNNDDVINTLLIAVGDNSPDVIYGDVVMIYHNMENVERRFDNVDPKQICTNLCHQSTFSKVNLMKKYHFDISFKIAADVNFFSIIHRLEDAVFEYKPIIVANYEADDGLSARNLKTMYQEYIRLLGCERFSLPWFKAYIRMQLKLLFYSLPDCLGRRLKELRLKQLYGKK